MTLKVVTCRHDFFLLTFAAIYKLGEYGVNPGRRRSYIEPCNRAKGIPILKKLAGANYVPALGRLVEYNLATDKQHIKYSQLKNEAELNAKEEKLKRMETLATIGRYGSGALGRQSSKNSETERSSDSVTCFAQGDYISGSYKTCKYDCMGSAYSLSIDATDICPLTVDG